MSKIPTKGDLKTNADANAEAARKARMPEPEAQTRLTNDFAAQGWTLTFRPARTGGSISWS